VVMGKIFLDMCDYFFRPRSFFLVLLSHTAPASAPFSGLFSVRLLPLSYVHFSGLSPFARAGSFGLQEIVFFGSCAALSCLFLFPLRRDWFRQLFLAFVF